MNPKCEHGADGRYCRECHPNNMNKNWKREFDKKFCIDYTPWESNEAVVGMESGINPQVIKDFIESLLKEERELQGKLREIAINNLITDVNTARKEERDAAYELGYSEGLSSRATDWAVKLDEDEKAAFAEIRERTLDGVEKMLSKEIHMYGYSHPVCKDCAEQIIHKVDSLK